MDYSQLAMADSQSAMADSQLAMADSQLAMVDSQSAMVDSQSAMADSQSAMADSRLAMAKKWDFNQNCKCLDEKPAIGHSPDMPKVILLCVGIFGGVWKR